MNDCFFPGTCGHPTPPEHCDCEQPRPPVKPWPECHPPGVCPPPHHHGPCTPPPTPGHCPPRHHHGHCHPDEGVIHRQLPLCGHTPEPCEDHYWYRPPHPGSKPLPPGLIENCPPLLAGPHGHTKFMEYWCTRVLPIVFDPSLTVYECVCKLAQELQHAMGQIDANTQDCTELGGQIIHLWEWVKDFESGDFAALHEYLEKYIQTLVFFGLTDDGHFVAYIPESWDCIAFGTTGYDQPYGCDGVYGRLTLSY